MNTDAKIFNKNQMEFIHGIQGWFNIGKSTNVICHINKRKEKTHMNISTDTEKAFDKIEHPFTVRTLSKLGIEGIYLHIIKTHSKHHTQ